MTQKPETVAARVLRKLYPGHDTFVRRVDGGWSAEVVARGQQHAPYRTEIIAEADTPEALLALVEDHCRRVR